jgi:DNA polymerase III epsilon subunit-like protein
MRGHIFCAVDVETTGRVPGYNEIIQLAIVPLNEELDVNRDLPSFNGLMCPDYPERWSSKAEGVHGISREMLETHGLSQDQMFDKFDEYFNRLELPENKRITPLAHNWAFEKVFLQHWMGFDTFDEYFQSTARDTFLLANSINDMCAWQGKDQYFGRTNLTDMCKKLGVTLTNAHDALADCEATIEVYRKLIALFGRKQ